MARALTIHRSVVPQGERERFMQKLRARRAYYTGANCRYWVFEESGLAGAFIEFIEAGSADTVAKALAGAPGHVLDTARIYQEVELD